MLLMTHNHFLTVPQPPSHSAPRAPRLTPLALAPHAGAAAWYRVLHRFLLHPRYGGHYVLRSPASSRRCFLRRAPPVAWAVRRLRC